MPRLRPLSGWDGPRTVATDRRFRPFSALFMDTLAQLQSELDLLEAHDVVIEAGFREQDLRLDGWPRASAPQPRDPGVRLAFESKHGPLIYQSDSCTTWQDNVRCLCLALTALRAVDRYGVTRRGQQYTGWQAIASGPALLEDDLARSIVMAQSGLSVQEPLSRHIKAAKRRSHPDAAGGSVEAWARLEKALAALGV